ncbi:TetR/AcrR family transcriptional regulator [Raineyella fluvialis]|uniref:TetR/AcrR family transcriptional regulator n=1 Tax=Raineyella fluvialis TaxID=2662261 RepID=UPI001E2AA2A4|nr:TetR/AcrR family transcriptional regulator [Raineyella fluvialis]
MTQATDHPRRPGRPRANPATQASGLSTRDQILDAAAALFVEEGFGACTTRQIAERAGIRQASVYYHFASKDEVLLVLLSSSIRPSLAFAVRLREDPDAPDDPAVRLCALVIADVRLLAGARHNIASLYGLPEVQEKAQFAGFRAERHELITVYGDFAGAVVPLVDRTLCGTLVMQLVESVIGLRTADRFRTEYEGDIAKACLRMLGVGDVEIDLAVREARAFLEDPA